MSLVYLLWYHGEDGPEGLVATLDKEKVCALAEGMNTDNWFLRAGSPHLIDSLASLLETQGGVEGVYPLMGGWGGLHLQITQLR